MLVLCVCCLRLYVVLRARVCWLDYLFCSLLGYFFGEVVCLVFSVWFCLDFCVLLFAEVLCAGGLLLG